MPTLRPGPAMLAAGLVAIGCAAPGAAQRPVPTDERVNVIYDMAPIARVLHGGYGGVPGLRTDPGSHRQHPLGDPFPATRWIGKVNHRELTGRSPAQIADLLQARMRTSSIGGAHPRAGLVGLDEVGAELEDGRLGPRFLAAMRILAARTFPGTGEPMSRRVVLYIAPKFVANVGARHNRGRWDSAMAAARLSGAVFLQMYHARGGRVTGPASRAEFRRYPAVWRGELGPQAGRLRFLFSGVGSQDAQWRDAASTPAGRATLAAGAGAYRLGTAENARAWLRNWNRWSR